MVITVKGLKKISIVVLALAAMVLSGCSSGTDLSGKKIAILIDERYLHVYAQSVMEHIHKLGGETVIVAVRPGTITAMDDPIKTLAVEQVTAEVDVTHFDALFVPGGFSHERLIGSFEALEFIRQFNMHRKVIAGICAGTSVMAESGVLEGKKATGSSSTLITRSGASYSTDPVVVDGNIVTAQSSGMAEINKLFTEAITRAGRGN